MDILTAHKPTTDIEAYTGESDTGYLGWFCIQTVERFCRGCDNVYSHVHWRKRIVVWEEHDCESILKVAAHFMKRNADPHIIDYQEKFGPAIPFDVLPPIEE